MLPAPHEMPAATTGDPGKLVTMAADFDGAAHATVAYEKAPADTRVLFIYTSQTHVLMQHCRVQRICTSEGRLLESCSRLRVQPLT